MCRGRTSVFLRASETGVRLCQRSARQHGDQKLCASYAILKPLVVVQARGGDVVLGQREASVLVNKPIAPGPQPRALFFEFLQCLLIGVVRDGKSCQFKRIVNLGKIVLNPELAKRETSR